MAQGKQPEGGKGEMKERGGGQQELQPRRHRGGHMAMRPFEDMERLYESFFPRGWLSRFDWPLREATAMTPPMPAVDVIDHENEIVVRAEVPGVSKDQLDVSMGDNSVTIRGRTEHEEKEEKEEYYRHEMSYGEFSRTVPLPQGVDAEKATAKCKDGVLEVRLPKLESSKRRSVTIEGE